MKRRGVLKLIPGLAATGLVGPGCQAPGKDKLSFFIVSDAHMGWSNPTQPSIDEQTAAISVIKKRFSDVDLWIDTGDAHHGNLQGAERQAARLAWLDTIANALDSAPLLYVPGNHELGRSQGDPEMAACQLGSLSHRPYYSFSLKGIHFVSLPQLLDTIYITRETLDWLALDLALHQHQSVIVLSHNAITGTTYDDGATAYRRTINSDEVLDVLATHPQVLAWMHGHNHGYEIVRRDGRLYVSNGRIGGFTPTPDWGSLGQGHLGGVYGQIDQSGLSLRCFSATEDRFMDEIGLGHLSASLRSTTSFDVAGPAAVGVGHGRQWGGTSTVIAHHFISDQPRGKAVVDNLNHGVVNENPSLNYPKVLADAKKIEKKVIGLGVKGPKKAWSATEQALQFGNGEFEVYFPHTLRGHGLTVRGPYYTLLPGQRYQFDCHWTGSVPADLSGQIHLFDANGEQALLAMQRTSAGRFEFEVPSERGVTFGVVRLDLVVTEGPLGLEGIKLHPSKSTSGPELARLRSNQVLVAESSDRSPRQFETTLTELKLEGATHQLHRWHLQQDDLKWQIRNAVATSGDDASVTLQATELCAGQTDIICVPISGHSGVYVKRLRNVTRCALNLPYHLRDSVTVVVEHAVGPVSLVIANADQVERIEGGEVTELVGNDMVVRQHSASTISVVAKSQASA